MPLTRAQAASEVMWDLVNDPANGYSQPGRQGDGTVKELTLSDGQTVEVAHGDADCSEAVRRCYAAVGVLPWGYWDSYTFTGNEADMLTSHGFVEVGLDDVQDGDVLFVPGHTEMVIDMDGRLVQAGFRHSEYYGIDGEPGDQTGDESSYSDYDPSDWECAFRYAGPEREDTPAPAPHVETPEEKEARQMQPVTNNGGDVFRLYNPYSGAHHFTTSAGERDGLTGAGWKYEGVAWTAKVGTQAIYRLYNGGNGDHMLTPSFDEAKACADAGWMYEGVPFMASGDGAEIYRLYNPNGGLHHFTASAAERDSLVSAGWQSEGTTFKA